jgi:NAD(P)H-dependent flavin oxidoreductase YrpB (nitropropane dioxygenase family)
MKKFLISAAAAAIMTGAAYAQTATEFYVVQDTATKKCTIVDKKPATKTTVVVGDGKVFKTRTEAETGMKTIKVCTN